MVCIGARTQADRCMPSLIIHWQCLWCLSPSSGVQGGPHQAGSLAGLRTHQPALPEQPQREQHSVVWGVPQQLLQTNGPYTCALTVLLALLPHGEGVDWSTMIAVDQLVQ